ncbi:MAG: hypothetical protein CFE36_14435 [Sphingomonadaceae bacterium PASS1]|nr:MAG: hypothetical protein CFE36_14435 [Sphingomonadaceae bacterium PASS1]
MKMTQDLNPSTHMLAEMNGVASNFVEWHRKHSEAYNSAPLLYIDALIDALVAANQGNTARDAVAELLQVMPGMTENQAFSVALTKFPGINLDSTIP